MVVVTAENICETVTIEFEGIAAEVDAERPIRGRCVDTGEMITVFPWRCDVLEIADQE